MSSLSLRQVRYAYPGGPERLAGIDLDVPQGQVTALLGPNGAGKTTLLYLLLGWLQPASGQIQVEQQPLATFSRRAMARIMGLVPQQERTVFEFSVREFVLLGRAAYLGLTEAPLGSDLTIARQALEEVGIGHLERRMLSTLSGGERQLAIIARALAQQPHILLLDEPTAHLDLSYQGRLLQVLSDLAGHGVTVLFTTHDPNAAASVADYLVLMAQGQIKAAGRLPEVLNAALLSDTYGVGIEVISLAGRPYVRRLEWPRG
jgi:iron complex transport system ATP-binding protein